MAEKLINITAPQYRCTIGHCPAVYRDRTPERYRCEISVSCPAVLDDDSGNFVFIGEHLDPLPEELAGKVSHTEAAIKLSADLLLSSIGVSELVEAAEPFERWLSDLDPEFSDHEDDIIVAGRGENVVTFGHLRALREALSRIKGGANG